MSLKEKTVSKITGIYEKGKFAYKMGFNSDYRASWVYEQVQSDLSKGVLTTEQSEKILEQSKDPKTSRHLAETFAMPIAAYGITLPVVGSIAVYAYLSGDPIAWGYTASHFATQQIPKVSISSVVRSAGLAGSILYDHVNERSLGNWQRNSAELTAVGLSAISWMGIGNAGPFLRMVAGTSPDLGMYLASKVLKGRALSMIEKAASKAQVPK